MFKLKLALFVLMAIGLIFSQNSFAAFEDVTDNSCVQCHNSLKDEEYKKSAALWADSIHAQIGNTCDGCHGGDPTQADKEMSKKNNYQGIPAEEKVVDFCGKCHREIAKRFMTSAHGEAEILNCVNCHSSHAIRSRSDKIITKESCGECHEDDGIPEKLNDIFTSLYKSYDTSKEKVKLISGFPTGGIEKNLKKDMRKLREIRRVNHAFDLEVLEKDELAFYELIDETNAEIDRLTELTNKREFWGYVLVSTFLALAIATVYFNRDLE